MSKKLTTEEFIEKAKKKYGNKYDYSDVEYVSAKTKIRITCPIHGKFELSPEKFLNNKYGCYQCSIETRSSKRKIGLNNFIKKAKEIHGDKYDYSKVVYVNNRTKVCIICPQHGEFWQTPDSHLRKNSNGCDKCANSHKAKTKTKTTEQFIKEARQVHGDKYNYSKVNYENCFKQVCIICPKHGEFWQTPDNHLQNKGCPHCLESKLEENVRKKLNIKNIEFSFQKTFDWLKFDKKLKLDFYLPSYKIGIECQGLQHFKSVKWFGGKNGFKDSIKRDKLKKKLCEEHGIKIFYYSNLGINYPYKVYENFDKMLKDIEKYHESMLTETMELPN